MLVSEGCLDLVRSTVYGLLRFGSGQRVDLFAGGAVEHSGFATSGLGLQANLPDWGPVACGGEDVYARPLPRRSGVWGDLGIFHF